MIQATNEEVTMTQFKNKKELINATDEEIREFFANTTFEGIFSKEIKSKKTDYYKGHIHSIKVDGNPTNIAGGYVNVPKSANDVPEGECTFKFRTKEELRRTPDDINITINPKSLREKSGDSFIKKLQRERCAYGNAGLVRTQAESLKQLSAGIYTEEERFVYELLQNAVDAYVDTDSSELRILIEVKDDILCFMHNGAPLNERDIEGLCDIGKSNKASGEQASNKKKIGYKGIGFKSVFMQSVDYVCVHSGDYCFKFDKEDCLKYIPKFDRETLSSDDIPWQIVPIETTPPQGFNRSGYTVATYIRNHSNKSLVYKIRDLIEKPQFLLFLNANNIHISLANNGAHIISAKRQYNDGKVLLYSNDKVVSRWIVHTTAPISVDAKVKEQLLRDFNTPQKLKEADSFELSFAISLDSNNQMEALKDSVVYTFLPTSYMNLGTPFLVNANFITDAGRQQLHQHSEWNRLIFKSIPKYFFTWLSTLSPEHEEYYKVLPDLSPKSHDELTSIYVSSLKEAIETIPFIPTKSNSCVIKASQAIIDRYNFADAIGENCIAKYANNTQKDRKHDVNSFIHANAVSLMKSYGVYVFDIDCIFRLLIEGDYTKRIDLETDERIIGFLYNLCHSNKTVAREKTEELQHIKFIFDDKLKLNRPSELFFPIAVGETVGYDHDFSYINGTLYNKLNEDVITWFKDLGVKEPNNTSFVEYILSNPEAITKSNAVEIGRFLFRAWKKENYLDNNEDNASSVRKVPFLTKTGDLVPISNLYLSSKYHPEDDIEPCFDGIDYISEKYVYLNDWDDWSFFLKKCGIGYKLGLSQKTIKADSDEGERYKNNYDFLSKAADNFRLRKHVYTGYYGYQNPIINIHFTLNYISHIDTDASNRDLCKLVFSKLLSQPYCKGDNADKISGNINYWGNPVEDNLIDHAPNEFSPKYNTFLEYVVSKRQRFPNVMGDSTLSHETFLNTPIISKYGTRYLPIIDIDTTVDESWLNIIPFKKELQLDDYLLVLSRISEDTSEPNKELISSIYQKLVELGLQKSNSVKEWGAKNKLLSTSSNTFLPANELSYITVEGFKNETQAYVGDIDSSLRSGVEELLENLGVKVITKDRIKPTLDQPKVSIQLKEKLICKKDEIALLKGTSKDPKSFCKAQKHVEDKINESVFYKCASIKLSYGNENDTIERSTYATSNEFYYTGELKPTKMAPLVDAISKHLGLGNANEDLLIVLITDDQEELREYLKDKGYPIDLLPKTGLNPIDSTRTRKNPEPTLDYPFPEIKDFLGSNYTLPSERIKAEHVIARYRALKHIESLSEYKIDSSFDRKEFVKQGSYSYIRLEGGKCIHVQSAKGGIWYISPFIWDKIINKGEYICLCLGNGDKDFKLLKSKEEIIALAKETKHPVLGMNSSDVIEMAMQQFVFNLDSMESKDVHLMLITSKEKCQKWNAWASIFDEAFEKTGDTTID